MYNYFGDIMIILLFITYLFLGIIIPIIIFHENYANSKNMNENKPWIRIGKLIIYTFCFLYIILIVGNFYNVGVPKSTSSLCQNQGGWVYTCVFDSIRALVSLSVMFIFNIIYYKLAEREIYKLKGALQSIFLILLLIFLIFASIVLLVCFCGFLISTYYTSKELEIFRVIVVLYPMHAFALSTYWKKIYGTIKKS